MCQFYLKITCLILQYCPCNITFVLIDFIHPLIITGAKLTSFFFCVQLFLTHYLQTVRHLHVIYFHRKKSSALQNSNLSWKNIAHSKTPSINAFYLIEENFNYFSLPVLLITIAETSNKEIINNSICFFQSH